MKRLLIILGVFVLAFAVLAMIAPNQIAIEREVTIQKPKEVVFNYLKSLKNFNEWNPWAKLDPQATMEYRGKDGSVGAIAAWKGNSDVGVGEQEITQIIPGERVEMELRFKEPMETKNTAYFATEALNPKETKVKWGMNGTSPFPWNVFCFVLNMKKEVIKNFDQGLSDLKAILEKKK